MNKKGMLVFEIGMWIVRILMVIVILMGVALQVRTYINARLNLDVTEPALLAQVIGTSPVFLARGATGAPLPVIDVGRFERAEPALNGALQFAVPHAAAKLVLMELQPTGQRVTELKTIYLDKKYYDVLSAQTPAFLGRNVVARKHQWPVRIMHNGVVSQGLLSVEVLQPR
jgi:hypothetical protein